MYLIANRKNQRGLAVATKEDILEQIVEEYLIQKGYFVQHNIKYRPRQDHPNYIANKDSVYSDIDIIGVHPLLRGERKVLVVSCKSWQAGFNPESMINAIKNCKTVGAKPAWKHFCELTVEKWSDSFIDKVQELTGEDQFTHVTAITRLTGEKTIWEEYEPFCSAIRGNALQLLTLREMIKDFQTNVSTTLARTEVGRILQLLIAARVGINTED